MTRRDPTILRGRLPFDPDHMRACEGLPEGGKAEEMALGMCLRRAGPAAGMKGAGAPLKHAFPTGDDASHPGKRAAVEVAGFVPQTALSGGPILTEKVRALFESRGIDPAPERTASSIDPGRRA